MVFLIASLLNLFFFNQIYTLFSVIVWLVFHTGFRKHSSTTLKSNPNHTQTLLMHLFDIQSPIKSGKVGLP